MGKGWVRQIQSRVRQMGLAGLLEGYPSYLDELAVKSKTKSRWEADEEVFG
jgi:hypothetical protein